jgi:hypothetical protein
MIHDPRDYQQYALYVWEHKNLPRGKYIPDLVDIQKYVDHVWRKSGRECPPRVVRLPGQYRKVCGDATREELRFPSRGASEMTILHEIAHALTMTIDGRGDLHDSKFVGTYAFLASVCLPSVSIFAVWYSLDAAGIKYDRILKL